MSKFNEAIESILESKGTGYPKLDKLAKKLSNPGFWEMVKTMVDESFEADGENEDWADMVQDQTIKDVKATHKITSSDEKILKDLIGSYAYIRQTRG